MAGSFHEPPAAADSVYRAVPRKSFSGCINMQMHSRQWRSGHNGAGGIFASAGADVFPGCLLRGENPRRGALHFVGGKGQAQD